MDIENQEVRKQAIEALISVHNKVIADVTPSFLELLSREELAIWNELESRDLQGMKAAHGIGHPIT
ncbi:hypothetical protein HYV81_06540 [Candidatus Woesearchaeota archaeon]|nr:hypothetical protein [Candidatus Woesearchaeota archaeon]